MSEAIIVGGVIVGILLVIALFVFITAISGLVILTLLAFIANMTSPQAADFIGIHSLGEIWPYFNTWSGFAISFALGLFVGIPVSSRIARSTVGRKQKVTYQSGV